MHPLALGYLKQTGFTRHQQKDFDVISLFVDVLNNSKSIMEFHWRALAEAGVDLGLPDYYTTYTTIKAVFYHGWEKGDPTGELKALFREVVNGPIHKELDEYL